MLQRLRLFLVVLLLMFTVKIFGQIIPHNVLLDTIAQHKNGILIKKNNDKNLETFNYGNNRTPTFCSTIHINSIGLPEIVSIKNFYTNNLGSVCRLEYKFQKTTTIPLRLRLGSLSYTDYLEQKPNALKPI